MSLESAIENLDFRFMSLLDYGDAIRLNRLNPMGEYEDDFRFTQANPEHPLNHINRSKRMSGSDEILKLSELKADLFTVDVLEKIHAHLFDCCAPVRHSLVSALYYAGDQSSIPYIIKLVEIESDRTLPETGSEMIKNVARVVLWKLAPGSASNRDTVFVVSPEIELVASLKDFCQANDMNLLIGNLNLMDVLEVSFKVAILDWAWLGRMSQDDWLDVLHKLEATHQDYLLIITVSQGLHNWFSKYVIEPLNSPSNPVHFPSRLPGDHIVRIVKTWMDTGELDPLL